jgi:very-short-patch-repair endonuclease
MVDGGGAGLRPRGGAESSQRDCSLGSAAAAPRFNSRVHQRIGRWTVDFLWREALIAVEADSWDYHRGRVAFQDDHARDIDLRRRGFDVRRFSERQIDDEPERVVADLVAALAAAPALPPARTAGAAGRPRAS